MSATQEQPNDQAPRGIVSEIDRPVDFSQIAVLQNETGWDRLRTMYDLSAGFGPELELVKTGMGIGIVLGGLSGGLNYAKQAKVNYIRQNEANYYLKPKDAMKEMQDKMALEFFRGGFKLGWRMGLFSGIYVLGTVSGLTYRNKFGIAEHVASGAVAGLLFKVNLGVKGSLAGLVVGGLLGLVSGTTMCVGTKALGITVPEFRYWQHQYWMKEYNEKKAKWDKKHKKELSSAAEAVQASQEQKAETT
ncbi:putative RPII140-upstream protein [Ixodes scapularis]